MFVVRLPLQRAEAVPGDTSRMFGKPSSQRARILLVEDNPGNVMVATHFLDEFGYDVEVAVDGVDAVERIEAGDPFDTILMDIQMPRMDGIQATTAIRAFEAATGAARIPVVAMTAHALMHDRRTCMNAEWDDYIAKPIDPDRLQEMLKALIEAVRSINNAKIL